MTRVKIEAILKMLAEMERQELALLMRERQEAQRKEPDNLCIVVF